MVVRGDLAARELDRLLARATGASWPGMNVNVWDVNDAVQALIRSRAVVDPARLADPDVPLEELSR